MNYKTLIYLACFIVFALGLYKKQTLPEGFVYAKTVIPD